MFKKIVLWVTLLKGATAILKFLNGLFKKKLRASIKSIKYYTK